jgi:hypothetical protein
LNDTKEKQEHLMGTHKQLRHGKAVFEFDPVKGNGRQQLDKVETAAYIADIVLQLRNMAKQADLKFLVYFLEMSFQEAFSQSTRDENRDGE